MPVFLLASLVAGLGPESRIGMVTGGVTVTPTVMMLAHIYDSINLLAFGLGGAKGTVPESIADRFIVQDDRASDNTDVMTFSSGKDYERYREKLLQGVK